MSVSSVASANPLAYLRRPQRSGIDNTDNSGPPSDPLLSLFGAASGPGSSDPSRASVSKRGSPAGPCSPFGPEAMSALISAQGEQSVPGASRLNALVAKFDTDGDGKISKSEFEKAVGPNADQTKVDELFSELDSDDDGSVTQDELRSALQKAHGHRHHHHQPDQSSAPGQGSDQGSDPLSALLAGTQADGSTSQSSTNSDGSTTTTITYADGTKIDMTTPSQPGSAPSSAAAVNQSAKLKAFLEQMIGLQAKMFAPPSTDLSV